jgi:hypothetical protein
MTTTFTITRASWRAHPGFFEFSTETADEKKVVKSAPIPDLQNNEQVIGSFKQENDHFVCLLNTRQLIRLHVDFANQTVDLSRDLDETLELFPYTINFRNYAAIPRQIKASATNEIPSELLWCQEYQNGPQRMLAVAYATYAAASGGKHHSNLLIFPLNAQAHWEEHYHIEVLSLGISPQSIITKYRPGEHQPVQVWQKVINRTDLQFRSAHPHFVLMDDVVPQHHAEFRILDAATGDAKFFSQPIVDQTLAFPPERCFSKGSVFVLRGPRLAQENISGREAARILEIKPGRQAQIYHLAPEAQAELCSWDEITDISEVTGTGFSCKCVITGYRTLRGDPTIKEKIVQSFWLLDNRPVERIPFPPRRRSFSRLWAWTLPIVAILGALAYFFKGRLQKLWA